MMRLLCLTLAALLTSTTALSSPSSSGQAPQKFYGGFGVGRLTMDDSSTQSVVCHYDMVLCERIQGRPKTTSGLFVPFM
jgi:hypothetical protein